MECGARRRRFGPFPTAINARRANPRPQVIRPEPTASSQRQRVKSGARGRRSPKTDLGVFPHLECGARRRRFGPFPAVINARRANLGPQLIRLDPFASSQRSRVKSGAHGRRSPKTDLSVFPNLECGARRRRFGPFPAAINARRANLGPQVIRPDPFASSQRQRVKAAPVGAAVQKPTRAYSPIWSAAPAGAALARPPQRSAPDEPISVPS